MAANRETLAQRGDAFDLASIGPNFGLSLRLLDVKMMRRASEAFARLGLTPASATALLMIEAHPRIRHGELADALLIQRPNMTKLLKQMDDQGWLRREGSDGDRRHVIFSLSAGGLRLAARAQAAMRDLDASALAALTAAEREQIRALVEKMTVSFEQGQSETERESEALA